MDKITSKADLVFIKERDVFVQKETLKIIELLIIVHLHEEKVSELIGDFHLGKKRINLD